jgi:hypothetical protein
MKQLISSLIGLLVSTSFSFAITFTTINDGDWNDNTNVWSINGISPCNCSPGANVSADTIIIQNNLSFSSNLVFDGGVYVWIKTGSCLVNPLLNINVRNAEVVNNGNLSVNELRLGNLSSLNCISSVVNVRSRLQIYGKFNSNFSNIYVSNGNIDIYSSGSFVLTNNSKIAFDQGNFNNSGIATIQSGSCIYLSIGNFKNYPGATLNGDGSLISDGGNITNDGTYDPNLAWCVSGNSTGLPTPENCGSANANCTFAPLAAELLSFNVSAQDGANILSWYTLAEENGETYTLERSTDAEDWNWLATIPARNPGNDVTHYLFIDENPLIGLSYYKLSLNTVDGTIGFSAILGINSNDIEEVVIFPNPTSDHITVRFSKTVTNVNISIVDPSGAVLETYFKDSMIEETFHLPYPCGLYFVRIDSESYHSVMKVMKK